MKRKERRIQDEEFVLVTKPENATHFVTPNESILTKRQFENSGKCGPGYVWCGSRNSCIEYTKL